MLPKNKVFCQVEIKDKNIDKVFSFFKNINYNLVSDNKFNKTFILFLILKILNKNIILNYNFILFKALFLNKFASLIYLLTISVDLCPVIAIILLSSAPDSAAEVANPDLRLWPE